MTPPMTPLSAEFDEQMMDLADDAADLMQEDPGRWRCLQSLMSR